MAETFDYSNPTKVTIVNNLPAEEKVFIDDFIADGKVNIDAGTLQHAQILTLEADETIDGVDRKEGDKYFIRTNARMVQLYKTNQWVALNGGDTLIMKVEWGEEAAYFATLADEFDYIHKMKVFTVTIE
jgi:hypothetical protein